MKVRVERPVHPNGFLQGPQYHPEKLGKRQDNSVLNESYGQSLCSVINSRNISSAGPSASVNRIRVLCLPSSPIH